MNSKWIIEEIFWVFWIARHHFGLRLSKCTFD